MIYYQRIDFAREHVEQALAHAQLRVDEHPVGVGELVAVAVVVGGA